MRGVQKCAHRPSSFHLRGVRPGLRGRREQQGWGGLSSAVHLPPVPRDPCAEHSASVLPLPEPDSSHFKVTGWATGTIQLSTWRNQGSEMERMA